MAWLIDPFWFVLCIFWLGIHYWFFPISSSINLKSSQWWLWIWVCCSNTCGYFGAFDGCTHVITPLRMLLLGLLTILPPGLVYGFCCVCFALLACCCIGALSVLHLTALLIDWNGSFLYLPVWALFAYVVVLISGCWFFVILYFSCFHGVLLSRFKA